MILKPFTKKLRQEFLSSYNIIISNPDYEFNRIVVPNLSCSVWCIRFPHFFVTTQMNGDPFHEEGHIKLNLIERFYLWGAIRDKFIEIQKIARINRTIN